MSSNLNLLELGRRVTRLRERRKITQTDLAAKCGVTLKQINNVERARNGMSLELYLQLCRVFKLRTPPLFDKAA